jgi:peroxiredoxin
MKGKRIILLISLAVMIFASIANAQVKIGSAIEDFKLNDSNGTEKSFNDLKGKNGAVLVFLSTECPVVRGYNDRMSKLAADYSAKGINLIGINSNWNESPSIIKAHTAEHYKFPVLIDKGNVLADKLNAAATPETFYFDGAGKLVYHGAIDNDRTGENVTGNYLRDAIEAVLAGKTVPKAETFAIGCSIKKIQDK